MRRPEKQEELMDRKKVGIVLFNEVEVLDFCGPFEVFSVVRLNEEKRWEESSPFEVSLIAEKSKDVVTTGGMKVTADHLFESCPRLDILVVPGGWGDSGGKSAIRQCWIGCEFEPPRWRRSPLFARVPCSWALPGCLKAATRRPIGVPSTGCVSRFRRWPLKYDHPR